MSDRLDVCACGRRTQEDIPRAFAETAALAAEMIQPRNLRPTLADYFRDVEARRAMHPAVARNDALTGLHRALVELHDRERLRIPIEQLLFAPSTHERRA